VAGLALATGAWLLGPAAVPERILFAIGALAMMVTEPLFIASGLGLMAIGLAVHILGGRGNREAEAT
jgi:hypothetical protein